MIVDFLKTFTTMMADEPEKIRVECVDVDDTFSEITLYASKNDAGRLIGKSGKMINSIKTLVAACKVKDGKSYRILVKVCDE